MSHKFIQEMRSNINELIDRRPIEIVDFHRQIEYVYRKHDNMEEIRKSVADIIKESINNGKIFQETLMIDNDFRHFYFSNIWMNSRTKQIKLKFVLNQLRNKINYVEASELFYSIDVFIKGSNRIPFATELEINKVLPELVSEGLIEIREIPAPNRIIPQFVWRKIEE